MYLYEENTKLLCDIPENGRQTDDISFKGLQ